MKNFTIRKVEIKDAPAIVNAEKKLLKFPAFFVPCRKN